MRWCWPLRTDDVTTLLEIFGPDGKDFIVTGDDVQDKNSRADFTAMVQEKMHVDVDPNNPARAILYVGTEDWPTPVPIVKVGTNGTSTQRPAAPKFLTGLSGGMSWMRSCSSAAMRKPKKNMPRKYTTTAA